MGIEINSDSRFGVGAPRSTKPGDFFRNVESASFDLTICAKRAAVANAEAPILCRQAFTAFHSSGGFAVPASRYRGTIPAP